MAKSTPPHKDQWNLRHLYTSDTDTQMNEDRAAITMAYQEFVSKWHDRNDYLESAAILKEALDEYESLMAQYYFDGKEGYYFQLRSAQDEADPTLKAKLTQVDSFGKEILNTVQFFELRIAKIESDIQKKLLADPILQDYRHFLERLFLQASHLLSEPEEKIMVLKSTSAYGKWVQMTSALLAKEERPILDDQEKTKNGSFSEILGLLSNPTKKVRDEAAGAFNDILGKYVEIAESEVNAILENKKVDDQLRNYARPDAARHLDDDIASEVVDSLLRSVSAKFTISQRFYALKAKLLGVKKLEYHERNVEIADVHKKYSFDDASRLVSKVFTDLDKQFADIFDLYLTQGQLDVFPRKAKSNGAFCAHYTKTMPTYILLNHTDQLNDVLTLAHELGHGINNELMREKQNALNFGTPKSTAETASTFMEDFVLDELLKEADDQLKLNLLMMKLNGDISTIFRQVACYQFEQELHQEYRKIGYLSKEDIGKIFQKHMVAYMGDAVEQSTGSENWWVYWSHIRSFFYVYSYASGLLISKSLQAGVKKDPTYINKVKDFLASGLSDSPQTIFTKTGIDISKPDFWDAGLSEVEALLDQTEQLSKKLNKI